MQLTERHTGLLVTLIALHSFAVGAMFIGAPQWTLRFAGWPGIDPVFFAYQAGVFHVVLGAAYLIEFHRYRGVAVLLTAKTIAFVFLTAATLVAPIPWAVWTSGILDGMMGLVVWWAHRQVGRRLSTVDS